MSEAKQRKKKVCFACFASKRNGIFCMRNEIIRSEKYRKAALQRNPRNKCFITVFTCMSSPSCLVFLLRFFLWNQLYEGGGEGRGAGTPSPIILVPLFSPKPTPNNTNTTLKQHSHTKNTPRTQHSHTSHTTLTQHSHTTDATLTQH